MSTVSIIVVSVFLLGLVDVLLYLIGGNNATISRTLLGIEASDKCIILTVSYTFGLLMGHLFLYTTGAEPSTLGLIGRVIAALSPVLGTLVAFYFIPDSSTIQPQRHPFIVAGVIVAGFILGLTAGHFLVPQHI